jgi:nitrogen-specific signal transduction histidine kinase
LKSARLKSALARHGLWLGLLVLVVPGLVNLYLQYKSLAKLELTSAIARKMWLQDRLQKVADDVHADFRVTASKVLTLPPSVIVADSHDDDVANAFAAAPADGVKRYFIAAIIDERERRAKITEYDPVTRMKLDSRSMMTYVTFAASFPLLNAIRREAKVDPEVLSVSEDDPENRVILKPIVDGSSRIVGVAGMIVDGCYYQQTYFPGAFQTALRGAFSDEELGILAFSVRDKKGEVVASAGRVTGSADELAVPVAFLFKDWKVGVHSGSATYEQLARKNFYTNLILSAVLTIVLIGGVVFALRTAQREMKLSEMKTDFVSNVSHELRTPLASIRVFGELFRMGSVKDEETMREFGGHIEAESRRLTQLINNILDFSRIESGRKTYQIEPTDVVTLVGDTIRAYDIRLRQAGFTTTFDAPDAPLPHIPLDPDAISQAVVNLLDNAVKYSGAAREIAVTVARSGGDVTISVTDRGIGIPREEQSRIFERFYRVGTGLVHDVKGSGLGLALVKHIVEAHGGAVTIASEPGRGSTFTMSLPIGAAPDKLPPDITSAPEAQICSES